MADKKLVLIGLVDPASDDLVAAFNEWYLGNHVEDTSRCPNIISARCLRSVKSFAGDVPAGYITIYEIDGTDPEQAEAILRDWQANPDAWDERQPPNGSLKILGSGWYEEQLAF